MKPPKKLRTSLGVLELIDEWLTQKTEFLKQNNIGWYSKTTNTTDPYLRFFLIQNGHERRDVEIATVRCEYPELIIHFNIHGLQSPGTDLSRSIYNEEVFDWIIITLTGLSQFFYHKESGLETSVFI